MSTISTASGIPASTYSSLSTAEPKVHILLPTQGVVDTLFRQLHFMHSQEYDLDSIISVVTSTIMTVVGEIDLDSVFYRILNELLEDFWTLTQFNDPQPPAPLQESLLVRDANEHDFAVLTQGLEFAYREIAQASFFSLAQPYIYQKGQELMSLGCRPGDKDFEDQIQDYRRLLSNYYCERFVDSWVYNRDQVLVEFADYAYTTPL